MGCSNCFNGCADIVSDQCVKYTGIDIPGLGIVTGDPLLVIENQIINKILTLITGEGIIPVIDPFDLCPIVSNYLPISGDITLNDVIHALIKSICDLDGRVTLIEGDLAVLNSNYTISCLTGVFPNSGTHDIVQAVIDKLCDVDTALTLLSTNVTTNYVLIADIDSYIASYLASIPATTLYNSKMIPYVAVPYFGPVGGIFDITGAGIGDWIKIYLCNGQNLTPDLRGRVLVGATTMGNTAFNPAVDPGIVGNPAYSLNTITGANQAFLTNATQLPPHSHNTTVTIIDPGHVHPNTKQNPIDGSGSTYNYDSVGDQQHYGLMDSGSALTGITATATNASVGASEGHNNIQPVHATNYIIYIP